jgi:hypothetical protein
MTNLDNNYNEYPAYLDAIPELDAAYDEQSGCFEDAIHYEPVTLDTPPHAHTMLPKTKNEIISVLPTHAPKATTPQNQAVYRRDTFAEIERALYFIPADVAREDWVKIGAALKTEGDYFELFNQWSSNSDNYKAKDCQNQWRSFKTGIITIGTLFHYAKQYGYKPESNGVKPDYQAIAKRKAESQAKAAEQPKVIASKQAAVAKHCADSFATATDAPANHPYLLRKQIPAMGIKVDAKNNLLIPIFNADKQIISLQSISPNGQKLFTKDSATKGGFFLIGEIYTDCAIRIAEGYSKAVRSYLSNNEPVFVAFSAANLAAVAQMVRNQYPSRDIIMNADNNALNFQGNPRPADKNTGLIAATAAAKLINGFVCVPYCNGSDFDDVFSEFGHEETVRQLSIFTHPNPPQKSSIPDINELFKPKPAPHYPPKKYLTPEQASTQIQTLSDDFFKNLSGNVAIKASAGSGKTRAVINSIAKIAVSGQVHVFVPTHDLANEWQNNLQQTAPHLNVLHLYGRGSSDSTDHFCNPERYAKVKAVQDKKLSVFATMCKQNEIECPFFKECRYINQFNQDNDIVIFPHSYLSLNHSTLEKKPAAVVIDESFYNLLVSSHKYPINLINEMVWLKRFRFDLLESIAKTKEEKVGFFQALKQVTKTDSHQLIALLNELFNDLSQYQNFNSTHGITPNTPDHELKNKLSEVKLLTNEINIILTFLKELELSPEREYSQNFKIEGDYYVINKTHTDNRFNYYLENNIPILMIDADSNETIINKLLTSKTENDLKESLPFSFNEINVKRTAKVTQYTNSQYAQSRFFPKGKDNLPDIKRIATAAKTVIKLSQGKKTLLVTYKALENALLDCNEWITDLGYKFDLPDNINILHFGAIRGVDAFKDYEKVIILGRNQPPAAAMENLAAALFWDDPEPIIFTGGYQKQERQYRTADGKIHSKEIHVHADKRVQILTEQVRESETLQAIDRLRFIHNADASREIHILADTVLDIDVDIIADSTKLIPKGRTALAEIMELNGGILPTSPKFLFNHYPDKFDNIQQVKNDLKRVKDVYSNLYIRLLPSLTYRISSQKTGKDLIAFYEDSVNLSQVISKLESLHGEQIHVTGLCEPMRCEETVTVSEKIIFTLELLENVQFPPLEEPEPERDLEPIAYGITGIYSGYASNTLLRPVFNALLCPVT